MVIELPITAEVRFRLAMREWAAYPFAGTDLEDDQPVTTEPCELEFDEA